MAPLFTIGGALGQVLGGLCASLLPAAGIDLKMAGLVGMAAMFAGASRAFFSIDGCLLLKPRCNRSVCCRC